MSGSLPFGRGGVAPAAVAAHLALALALPQAALGQGQEASAADTAAAADTAEAPKGAADTATYRREVFTYPSSERRDPFRPLTAGEGSGVSLDDLVLSGIIHSPAAGSVAVLTDPQTGERHRLREGDRIGDARLVAIHPSRVVFRETRFGASQETVLRLNREEPQ